MVLLQKVNCLSTLTFVRPLGLRSLTIRWHWLYTGALMALLGIPLTSSIGRLAHRLSGTSRSIVLSSGLTGRLLHSTMRDWMFIDLVGKRVLVRITVLLRFTLSSTPSRLGRTTGGTFPSTAFFRLLLGSPDCYPLRTVWTA